MNRFATQESQLSEPVLRCFGEENSARSCPHQCRAASQWTPRMPLSTQPQNFSRPCRLLFSPQHINQLHQENVLLMKVTFGLSIFVPICYFRRAHSPLRPAVLKIGRETVGLGFLPMTIFADDYFFLALPFSSQRSLYERQTTYHAVLEPSHSCSVTGGFHDEFFPLGRLLRCGTSCVAVEEGLC